MENVQFAIIVVIWSWSFVIFDFGNAVICSLYININIYIIVTDFDSVFFSILTNDHDQMTAPLKNLNFSSFGIREPQW